MDYSLSDRIEICIERDMTLDELGSIVERELGINKQNVEVAWIMNIIGFNRYSMVD